MQELTIEEQQKFMRAALKEAGKAGAIGEVPIGAVIVHDGEIIGRGFNLREHAQDAIMHAEIMAIQEANRRLKSWRLEDCQMFVTLEPCPMCAGAIINSRIPQLYFGARDPKAGVVGSLYNLLTDERFNHQVEVHERILAKEAGEILQQFFRKIRAQQKARKKAAKAQQTKDA
ncbi:tRNA adenosine(34) deaminase TadA [Periweissella ghanensis]|uniref:tRNA-specific adenosine deaminase n=1 Tax=Periweissella ghanensis TaxID=467997 RepID=A0ABM8ZDI6_9LACO|nr:tRNA adenosine(34) deaminase TadA [Periweissella ghanensis]MCM0601629.1 tRNA adenosine(34) deaminase TadA [Periweissella ghanensis]CAH0418708.1 tRNA-specific adenosine deaminase [Periweissella ghanensis]